MWIEWEQDIGVRGVELGKVGTRGAGNLGVGALGVETLEVPILEA